MTGHHFISYSTVNAQEFAFDLHDALEAGPPPIPAWLDKRDIKPGRDWDDEIEVAIRSCSSLLFVMSKDSVESQSQCKHEWSLALAHGKPIVPLLYDRDAVIPIRLREKQYIDFTRSFNKESFKQSLARLRNFLNWLESPAGVLQALEDHLKDAQRAASTRQRVPIRNHVSRARSPDWRRISRLSAASSQAPGRNRIGMKRTWCEARRGKVSHLIRSPT